jgi:hypothetical protein
MASEAYILHLLRVTEELLKYNTNSSESGNCPGIIFPSGKFLAYFQVI